MVRPILVAAFLLWASAAWSRERPPYLVDASSTSVRACWRHEKKDACRTIDGLKPGEPFEYFVPGTTGPVSGRTLPPLGEPLRFAVFGDSGMGTVGQKKVAALLEKRDPDLVLFVGDVVYPTGVDADYDAKYFKMYGKTLSRAAVFPCVGNHDYGNTRKSARIGEKRFQEGYARVFRRPKYYSFDAGPAHFVSLDDNGAVPIAAAEPLGFDSAQRRWLEKDLKSSKARWKFVFLHVPLFSTYLNHGDNAGLRASLQSLFERYHVDAVFAGHDHLYQRSKRMDKIVYFTVGTGGGTVLPGPVEDHPWLEKEVLSYGLAMASVDRKSFSLEFIDDLGAMRDRYRIDKP